MTESNPARSRGLFLDHPFIVMAILATVAMLAGLMGCRSVAPLSADDEPPIRVRNGSITIELQGGKWTGNGTKWKSERGRRRNAEFLVWLGATNATDCGGATRKKGQTVRFLFDDNNWVELIIQNGKMELTSSHDLTRSPGGTLLTLSQAPHIAAIRLGTEQACTFSAKDQGLDVLITEP